MNKLSMHIHRKYLKIHNHNLPHTTKTFQRQVACWSDLQTAHRSHAMVIKGNIRHKQSII